MHRNASVLRISDGHVGVTEQEQNNRSRLRFAQWKSSCTKLSVAPPRLVTTRIRTPVFRIVAVQVKTAYAVLIEPTVTVIVYPLRHNDPLALTRTGAPHQATGGITVVKDHRCLFVSVRFGSVPDLIDHTITVEILGWILVHQAVTIAVVWPHAAAVRLSTVQVHVRAIGVVLRSQVDCLGVDQIRDSIVVPVALEQMLHEP